MSISIVLGAGLIWLILGVYWVVGDNYAEARDGPLGNAAIWWEIGFYFTLVVCLVAAAALAAGVSGIFGVRASTNVTIVLTLAILGTLAGLPILSFINSCTFGVGFPLPANCN